MNPQPLGDNLPAVVRRHMAARNIVSGNELAALAGVAPRTVHRMLAGQRRPTDAILRKLADALAAPVGALRRAAGLPAGETAPFVLPSEAHQLDHRQRAVVVAMIRALNQASGRTPVGDDQDVHNLTLRAVPRLVGRPRDPNRPVFRPPSSDGGVTVCVHAGRPTHVSQPRHRRTPNNPPMTPIPHEGPSSCAHPAMHLFRQALERYGMVAFVLRPLNDRCGETDLDHGVIALHPDLTDGELNATVVHELGHMVDPDGTEDAIESRTARLLISDEALSALLDAANLGEAAARLDVDPALVRARMRDHGCEHRQAS